MPSRRALLAGLGAGGLAGLAGCSAGTLLEPDPDPVPVADATPGPDDWPLIGYDARNTRYNAGASPPTSAPEERWRTDLGWAMTPTVRGTRLVVVDYEGVTALRTTDGEVAWRAAEGEQFVSNYVTPVLGAERVYYAGPRCVRGFDLTDGTESWRATPCRGANNYQPTVADGRVHMEHGGYLSAIDDAGRTTWASAHDARPGPAVVDGRAYVATAFTVKAVDLSAPVREPLFEGDEAGDDHPATADRERATAWELPRVDPSMRVWHSPAVVDGTVYAPLSDLGAGRIVALDAETGDERWRFRAERGAEDGWTTAPVVADDAVHFGADDGFVYRVGADGERRWRRDLSGHPWEVVGADEVLLVRSHRHADAPDGRAGFLHALDLATGETRWRLGYDDELRGLSVAGGSVYASLVTERNDDGEILGTAVVALG
ncbi:PQQ-binding-like beta-propeller repeat protein [Halobium salinum]|uniref:PQQ-binding-like beta-propeller repeat protein n=1 Tax=Halobium salinum TaxID=1364940 RepID=A0ABD5PBI7_9EURY|nr:PQQ-binding-like beta-propeller repeat protein [Halobium salinum]